jgi:HAE1 family hydrophobic/amphiphilic exporter-1
LKHIILEKTFATAFFGAVMVGVLFLAIPAQGAEVRTLTLDQAIAIAMEKNRDIEKSREYAHYVQGKYVEERAAALPQLSFTASYSASRDASQTLLPGASDTIYSGLTGISLSQPLFTWGKIGAAIRAAEKGLKTADEQLRLARQVALRDVSVAFYDILLLREYAQLAQETLQQKMRYAEEAHQKYSAGIATDYDVLVADVAVDNARPEVIRTGNQLRIAQERLRFLLALDETEVVVSGSLEVQRSSFPTFAEALQTALEKRPELLEQRHRINVYRELVTIAAADNKPRIDLKGQAGWNRYEYAATTNDGTAWSAGIYLSFPFFDGLKTDGKVQQAMSELSSRQIDEQKLVESISLEVRTALSNLHEADEILGAIGGSVKQAERLLQITEKGFEYGVKIRLEVDDAQLSLLRSKGNLARASRDYLVARVDLAWAMGTAGEEAD